MGDAALAVEVREGRGKGVARKLRAGGRVPAVVYGHGDAAVAISLDPEALELIISGHAGINTLIDLEGAASVAGKVVVVKDLQREPVRGAMVHADLFEIDANATVRISVSIQTIGTAVGVAMDAGILDHVLRDLEVECLPSAIPDSIEVDVTELHTGNAIHAGDIALPEGVTLVTQKELTVIACAAPQKPEEEEVPEEEGAEAAETPADGEATEEKPEE